MSYASPSRYREMEVLAMQPAQRVVLLYSHLLVLLRQARRHLERGEIEQRGERLFRAEEIVRELQVSLNHEVGGELAGRLANLYTWMVSEFAGVHARPDLERLDAVTKIVAELYEAWQSAALQVLGQSA
ncbi:MAG TPA: flagellar export chaperone FliS [Gemmatimonadales bacterium]|jgi:flagellar protein FliS